ncbi:MAG: hypothetical protein H6735_10065 [Alphaproteobacteria bacterium]|nr:hypothetical protein [Alphaproteobacteria bacterium]
MRSDRQRLILAGLASVTLGLAPFAPEPHVVGKIRWVAGGAVGMGAMDWGDLLLHGAPWAWLLFELALVVRDRLRPPADAPPSP